MSAPELTNITHVPTVGTVYYFEFLPGYNYYDGVYRLAKLVTYDKYLEDGGNLLEDFFTPNGKTQEDFNAVLPQLRQGLVMYLDFPDTLVSKAQVRAPLGYLGTTPDHNVKEYHHIGFTADIGVTDNPEDLSYVKAALDEHLESALGITPKTLCISIGDVWMTEDQYQDVLAQRDESKKKALTYYNENQKIQKRISQVQTILQEYEKTILIMQKEMEHVGSILASVPLTTITFDSNGGSGTMDKVQWYSAGRYELPQCTFTPPEGMTFNQWCDDATGQGTFLLDAGDQLDLAAHEQTLTIYATWKALASEGDGSEDTEDDTAEETTE